MSCSPASSIRPGRTRLIKARRLVLRRDRQGDAVGGTRSGDTATHAEAASDRPDLSGLRDAARCLAEFMGPPGARAPCGRAVVIE